MATSSSWFSLVSLFESHLRNTFTSSGLSSQSIDIDSDTTLHFWSPKHPSLTLPSLVLLHGFGGNSVWQWSSQVQCLSTHFNLYVPDLIFFGESFTTSLERSEIFQAVSVGKLLELLGVTRYSVIGTSYGGFVAYHMARLWPERVEKIVIVNSALNLTSKDTEELLKKAKIEKIESLFLPSSSAELLACFRLMHKRFPIYIPEFLLNDILNILCNENRKEKLELLKGTIVGQEDILSISHLHQEVLIIWGEDDPIFSLEKGYELKELIGDKVSMEVMPKTSHTPQNENPKLFNEIVKKFFDTKVIKNTNPQQEVIMATSSSCFSLVSWYESHLRNTFTSAGLSSKSINIDADTTMHYWSPKHPLTLPPLVLIHGFGGSSLWQWSKQLQYLCSHFTLYLPDLIFIGKSVTNSSDRSEVFQAVSLGKLFELLGVTRYSVMGTSYGGFVAYHMARLWPDRVEKVIIASSAINMRQKEVEELLKKEKIEKIEDVFMPSSPDELLTLIRLMHKPRFPIYIPNFLLNDFLNVLCNENRKERLELLKGTTVGKEDIISLPPLQQEVLIVWGEDDPIFPLEKGYELKELIGDNVRIEVMPKTSHMPQIENPKVFNDIVKKFLLGRSPS
ncbi:hypothetical protein MKW94_013083 [Papaver nudicaule]|uniref:AB hydrolase-1 domain-containing protein n=1 Tax=Papaver nudicaule TaxID=74823 RepID=A0AA41V9P4_PAPNU|nr:hypothetical protein [Papaver nudicaule]